MKRAVLLLLMLSSTAANGSHCRDEQVKQFVERIGEIRSTEELATLRKKPSDAVACLIDVLRVVDATSLRPEEKASRRDDFRVVWAIRALRYLTGKEFCGAAAHFDALEEDRRQFLTIKCGPGAVVSFFGVWMSRDVVYLAPREAQEEIIQEWIRWYETQGSTYSYPVANDADWYF
jgi:hypothetical protein